MARPVKRAVQQIGWSAIYGLPAPQSLRRSVVDTPEAVFEEGDQHGFGPIGLAIPLCGDLDDKRPHERRLTDPGGELAFEPSQLGLMGYSRASWQGMIVAGIDTGRSALLATVGAMALHGGPASALLPARPQVFGHEAATTSPRPVEIRIHDGDLPTVVAQIAKTAAASCDLDALDIKAAMKRAEALGWPPFVDPAVTREPLNLRDADGNSIGAITVNAYGASGVTILAESSKERIGLANLTYTDQITVKDGVTERRISCSFDQYPGDQLTIDQEAERIYSARSRPTTLPHSNWRKTWSLRPSAGASWPKNTTAILAVGGDPTSKVGHGNLFMWVTKKLSKADP